MEDIELSFTEEGIKYLSEYKIYEDRIERKWRSIGKRGTVVLYPNQFSGRYQEVTTFGYRIKGNIQTMAIYLILGLIMHLGFENHFFDYVGYLLYVFAGASCILLISKLRKENWIYFTKPDGSTAICIREKGLKGVTRNHLIEKIEEFSSRGQPVAGGDAAR